MYQSVNLDDSPFLGSTSRPGTATFTEYSCQRCGSSLAKRRERSLRKVVGGVTYLIDTGIWRKKARNRREIPRFRVLERHLATTLEQRFGGAPVAPQAGQHILPRGTRPSPR